MFRGGEAAAAKTMILGFKYQILQVSPLTDFAASENILQGFGYGYVIFANLAVRTENTGYFEERFTYNQLNRLDSSWLNGVPMGILLW